MPTGRAHQLERIDALLDQAGRDLASARCFDAERAASLALHKAFALRDFARMAKSLAPLWESRRRKRDLALRARCAGVIDAHLPRADELAPGCYLVAPPRVGADARTLRELANRENVPILVIAREPATRDGRWPVVAIGPVTVRTTVLPPNSPARPPPADRTGSRPRRRTADSLATHPRADAVHPPAPEWFLNACQALAEAALARLGLSATPSARVASLLELIGTHPDHEGLHAALAAACEEAVNEAPPKRRVPRPRADDSSK